MRDFLEDDKHFASFIVEFVAVSLGDGGGGVEWVDG